MTLITNPPGLLAQFPARQEVGGRLLQPIVTHEAEDHLAAQSDEAGGSIAVLNTLPGPPDEPVLREGFWPEGTGRPLAEVVAAQNVAFAAGNGSVVLLSGAHALAYAEFQAAARELELAGLAVQAAQRRFQAALAKLSPIAAKAR